MEEWTGLLKQARDKIAIGDTDEAMDLCRQCLLYYSQHADVKSWSIYTMMQCEVAVRGNIAARDRLVDIIDGVLNWAVKFNILEMALKSSAAGDKFSESLVQSADNAIERYRSIIPSPQDININASNSVARHVARLSAPGEPPENFRLSHSDTEYPTVKVAKMELPEFRPPSMCNRLPDVIDWQLNRSKPPTTGMSFRHVGKAYIARSGISVVVLDAERRMVPAPYGHYPKFLKEGLEASFATRPVDKRIEGKSLFICDMFSDGVNYCHWLLDNMPRVAAARQSGLKFNAIIGPHTVTTNFERYSLDKMLKPKEIYSPLSEDGALIECDDFTYVDLNIGGIYHPTYGADRRLTSELRKKLTRGVKVKGSPKRRLYVPRRHSRRVINESELTKLLIEYNFESVNTDVVSMEEQIQLFATAEAVVGPHGAALTNMLFVPEHCKVLELFPAFGGTASFYSLCQSRNIDYSCYIDDISYGANMDASERVQLNVTDMLVDLTFVRRWLDSNFSTTSDAKSIVAQT